MSTIRNAAQLPADEPDLDISVVSVAGPGTILRPATSLSVASRSSHVSSVYDTATTAAASAPTAKVAKAADAKAATREQLRDYLHKPLHNPLVFIGTQTC